MFPPLPRFPPSLFDGGGGGGGGGGELEWDEEPLSREPALLPPLSRLPRSREPLSRVLLPRSFVLLPRSFVPLLLPPSRGTMRSITRRGTSLPPREVESFEPAGAGAVVDGLSSSRTRRRHELSPERAGAGVAVDGSCGVPVEGRSIASRPGSAGRRLRQVVGVRLSPLSRSDEVSRSRPSPPPITRTVGPEPETGAGLPPLTGARPPRP